MHSSNSSSWTRSNSDIFCSVVTRCLVLAALDLIIAFSFAAANGTACSTVPRDQADHVCVMAILLTPSDSAVRQRGCQKDCNITSSMGCKGD